MIKYSTAFSPTHYKYSAWKIGHIHCRDFFLDLVPLGRLLCILLGLVPSAILAGTNAGPQTLDIEYDRWMRKWQSEMDRPDALQPALEV